MAKRPSGRPAEARPTAKNAVKAKPAGTSRAAQRAATREQIRAAAWELFSTVGFDETTTQAIAERAGVAGGTVFLYASGKADLLFMVMHDRLEGVVNERFASMREGKLIDRFMHVFGGLFRMYGEYPKMSIAFLKTLPGASGPNAQRTNTLTFGFLHRLALLVTDAQATGEVARDLNPNLCSQNVFGLYFMTLLGWLSGHYTLETALDPMLRSSLELQIRGFRP